MAKPYELEKALLEADKIQGVFAPSENSFHQIAPIPDYFVFKGSLPQSNIKPSFSFMLHSLGIIIPDGPNETVNLEVLNQDSQILFSYSYQTGSAAETILFDTVPFEKGSFIKINSTLGVNTLIEVRLFLRRVFINEI